MEVYFNSRLESFEKCPRQYWFRYVGKVKTKWKGTVEAFVGTRVHKALEQLYDLLQQGQLINLEQLLQWYDRDWDLRLPLQVVYVVTQPASP